MSQFENKEIIQAILIADNNVDNFRPLSDNCSQALIPLVNVPMLDYALEALNRSGIEEVFVYCSLHLQKVRDHIKHGIASHSTWSVNMDVHVIGGEGCRCFGDAMRDLDAKAVIRGNFILLGADTITNADLRPILEQHKKLIKFDKGAAATLIFKEATIRVRTGNEVIIAMDTGNNRLHYHQRLRLNNKEMRFDIPMEVFMLNSKVALMHNLLDPQIAIGSPSMLSLFSDNFDFETRDDFVRGILINEEILDSRIYVALLPNEQYARKANDWLSYQIIAQDIINRWVYPLVPDMGIHCLTQKYMFLRNNVYKSPEASVTKVTLTENVVVQNCSCLENGTIVSFSVIGANCKVGQNCHLRNVHLMDNVHVGDNCELNYCVVGSNAKIGANSSLTEGTVIGANCVLPAGTVLENATVKSNNVEVEDDILEKIGKNAFVIDERRQKTQSHTSVSDSEDEISGSIGKFGVPKMTKIPLTCEESDYSSCTDDDDDATRQGTPIPDDTNIFLSEVLDSLTRGYQEKSNPDFLILEINSSRYAYNMSLKEVNFFVVKAIFSMECIKNPTNNNVLVAINNVLKHLRTVMTNYIKTEDAMIDCLKALEEISEENEFVREKISQVVHYLYDKDIITEEAISTWYSELEDDGRNEFLVDALKKLVDWLNQSSDDEDESASESE